MIRPTITSGRQRWQSSVESTTAGRTLVAPAPGFKLLHAPAARTASRMRLWLPSDRRRRLTRLRLPATFAVHLPGVEALAMKRGKRGRGRKSSPKHSLNLPDLDQARSAVLNSLPSRPSGASHTKLPIPAAQPGSCSRHPARERAEEPRRSSW